MLTSSNPDSVVLVCALQIKVISVVNKLRKVLSKRIPLQPRMTNILVRMPESVIYSCNYTYKNARNGTVQYIAP